MKKIYFMLLPLVILFDILMYNMIANLMRTKSDIAVIIGVLLFCVDIYVNYLLIIFYKIQICSSACKKNEETK